MTEKIRPRLTAAVLVQKDGKFLLAERSKENANGFWVIPGGGVKFGETITDAAIREIKEETNLDVEIVRRIGYQEVINVPGKYHTIVFFHLARPLHDDVKAEGDVSDAKYFTVEEIKRLKTVQSVEDCLKQAGLWD